MSGSPPPAGDPGEPPARPSEVAIGQRLRAMNEALILSSLRQHELTEAAQKAEAVARENEERYRNLFDSIDEGFCVIEMLFDGQQKPIDYRFLEVNPTFERQTGMGDAVGRRMRELRPDLEAPWFEKYGRVALTGEPARFVGEAKSMEGRWFDVYAFRVGDPERRHVAVVFNDITARRKSEERLQESEVRYRRLFQSSKDGILILDAATRKIIDANAFISGLMGQEPSVLRGKELYEIGVFKDEAANKAAFAELQRKGYIRYDHLPLQKPDGETTHVEFVSSIYREGDRLVAQCTVRDITARVALERRVALQTQELAEQSARKDEFLAMLSHELRNPLAPIRSALHLLRLQGGAGEGPVQKQAFEVIERQVANMTKLVSDLLEVSRVVSGRVRLDLQQIDARQVVEHALQAAAPHIEQRHHAVSLQLCEGPVPLHVDPTRIEEVMVNLIDNAAKYTPDGGRIEISTELRPADASSGAPGTAKIRVRDNGVGIEPELLPRIFDLFAQADRSLARSGGGLGIGLSLARRLVELHGGSIEAHSDGPGRGSEFVVTLPLLAGLPAGTVIPEPGVPDAAPPTNGVTQRVLVVDDNADLVLMLVNALRHTGYQVRSARDGTDAMKLALEWRPHVVLLDIGLPGIDGYEVARRLRADRSIGESAAPMRIYALSGYGQAVDKALAIESGFDGHLTKPFDFDEIDRLIREVRTA